MPPISMQILLRVKVNFFISISKTVFSSSSFIYKFNCSIFLDKKMKPLWHHYVIITDPNFMTIYHYLFYFILLKILLILIDFNICTSGKLKLIDLDIMKIFPHCGHILIARLAHLDSLASLGARFDRRASRSETFESRAPRSVLFVSCASSSVLYSSHTY